MTQTASREATTKAANISSFRWIEDGKTTGFISRRTYGILNDQGQAFSFQGQRPSAWNTKTIAQTVADQLPADAGHWINPA